MMQRLVDSMYRNYMRIPHREEIQINMFLRNDEQPVMGSFIIWYHLWRSAGANRPLIQRPLRNERSWCLRENDSADCVQSLQPARCTRYIKPKLMFAGPWSFSLVLSSLASDWWDFCNVLTEVCTDWTTSSCWSHMTKLPSLFRTHSVTSVHCGCKVMTWDASSPDSSDLQSESKVYREFH